MNFTSANTRNNLTLALNFQNNNLTKLCPTPYCHVRFWLIRQSFQAWSQTPLIIWKPMSRRLQSRRLNLNYPYYSRFVSRSTSLTITTTSYYKFYNNTTNFKPTSWDSAKFSNNRLSFFWIQTIRLLWWYRQLHQFNYITLVYVALLRTTFGVIQNSKKSLKIWNYLLLTYPMKFPSHVILDMNRSLAFSKKTNLKWQDFYKTIFLKPSSLHATPKTSSSMYGKRIVVSKTSTYFVTNTSLVNSKNSTNSKTHSTKYYVPFRGKLTQPQIDLISRHATSYNLKVESSNTSTRRYWKRGPQNQLLMDTVDVKTASSEFNLYLKLTKRFLKVSKTIPNKTSSQIQPGPIRSNRGLKPLEDHKFCFKDFTVNFQTPSNKKSSQQQNFFSRKNQTPQTSQLYNLFDIHFLLKEMHYSKLKYSKTAERDIVSSGSAAIFAGFIGFLISEKFGIELVDSGDFYFIFMYCVFFGFSVKVFVSGLESSVEDWRPLSDPRSYTYKPHRWFTVFRNFFIYSFTMLSLFLRFLSRFAFFDRLFTVIKILTKPFKKYVPAFLKNWWL